MAAYIIANVDVSDPEQYKVYQQLSTHAMQTHAVKLLVRGGETLALEGDAPKRTVVIEFETAEAAQAFYDSPEYLAARQARENIAHMTMYVVQGV